MVWLPYSLLDTKGVLAALGERDSTKVLATNTLYWELICSVFSYIFEKPGTLLERAIKHEIDSLPDSVLSAMRYYRIHLWNFLRSKNT